MGFFNKLFSSSSNSVEQPSIPFGRYSDTYKTPEQYDAWDLALDAFEKGNTMESYRLFFKFLKDEELNNVEVEEINGRLSFEILQGSKKIAGYADRKKVVVAAKVAQTVDLNMGFMRRLMEENYKMEYGRFALDDEDDIAIVFNTYALDGSPYKLYYALKEVATKVDKLDDLLIEEFESLHRTHKSLLKEIGEEEKMIKYAFITNNIKAVLNEIDNGKIEREKYPGAIAYLLLNLGYKIDFLTLPEGHLMETLERINRIYFSKDGKNSIQKNAILYKEYKELLARTKEDYFKEMYRVKNTFGITKPVTHDRVVSFIDGELHNMDWYQENGYHQIALAIPGYIVGHCMFQFAVPKPDKELITLYYQVMEVDYFKDLGFQYDFVREDGTLNKRAIKRAISSIIDANKVQYPQLKPNTSSLDCNSLLGFAKSFLLMIRNLDLTKNI